MTRPLRLVLLALVLVTAPAAARVQQFTELQVEEEQDELHVVPGGDATAVFHLTNTGTRPLALPFFLMLRTELVTWTPVPGEDEPTPVDVEGEPAAEPHVRFYRGADAQNLTFHRAMNALLSPTSVQIPPGGTATLRVHVSVPEGMPFGPAGTVTLLAGGTDGVPIAQFDVVAVDPSMAVARWARAAAEEPAAVAAAAGAVGAAAAVAFLLRRDPWRFAPLVLLYARLARGDVLENETRARIHAAVEARPGLRYADLKRALGVNTGTLLHHLATLERHGFLRSRREGAHRCFYPSGLRLPDVPADPLTPVQRRVLAMLGSDGLPRSAVAARLGVSQQGANHHLKTLERKGRIVVRFVDGEWRCFAAEPDAPTA